MRRTLAEILYVRYASGKYLIFMNMYLFFLQHQEYKSAVHGILLVEFAGKFDSLRMVLRLIPR